MKVVPFYRRKVTTLQLFTVYDSGDGYDPDDLWYGLCGERMA